MRFPPSKEAERFRVRGPLGDNYGAFVVKRGVFRLRCIVCCGEGWDHVSVSLDNRCPTWEEMDHIKRLFWEDSEIVMQLHVTDSHKNVNPYCLHLWRPQTRDESEDNRDRWKASGEKVPDAWAFYQPIPLPPDYMV